MAIPRSPSSKAAGYIKTAAIGILLNIGLCALGPAGIATAVAVDVVAVSYFGCRSRSPSEREVLERPVLAVRESQQHLEELTLQEALRRSDESAKKEAAERDSVADQVDPAIAQAIKASLTTQDPAAREKADLERFLAESSAEASARVEEESALAAVIAASITDQGAEAAPSVGSGDELDQAIAASIRMENERKAEGAIEKAQLLFMTVNSYLEQPAENETLLDTMKRALETNEYIQSLEATISSLAEFQVNPQTVTSKGKGRAGDVAAGAGVGGYGEEEDCNAAPTSLPSLLSTLRDQRTNLKRLCKHLNEIIATRITEYISGSIDLSAADIRSLANYYNITETDLKGLANSQHLFADRLGELHSLVVNKNGERSIKVRALINELHG